MPNLTQKLIDSHLCPGTDSDAELALRIDQTLTQDATGTLVMLEFEALGLPHTKAKVSAQYVDHNLLQQDHKNPDDHLFLKSACERYGVWYSRPGHGVSHPVHMMRFAVPGQTLLGSDSHTCANGALGMLAIGTGGLEVAMAMAGMPFFMSKPKTFGVRLTGKLPEWVSAKDVILELLRRHGVRGGKQHIIEYHGDGVAQLSVWDRHVIANMGAELGATTSVFPADDRVHAFLREQGRPNDFSPLHADQSCHYDKEDELILDELEPLIAKPTSPGNVVRVREVAGEPIYQAYVGSSANPGFRDFAIVAQMVARQHVPSDVSLDINPSTSHVLRELATSGLLAQLIDAGARIHQPGCNGCIGMGQAPATGRNSLRTVPRNFPGRSGSKEDCVWLCSPETAAASALRGAITDPRDLSLPYPSLPISNSLALHSDGLTEPPQGGTSTPLVKGPNIKSLPALEPLPSNLRARVLLKVGDDISTDEILPAGSRVLPFRSNIDELAQFCFEGIKPDYARRAREAKSHVIVAGENYGQGSSREHAALAPRALGLVAVIAKSFSRIHRQNLVNFGVVPLLFKDPDAYDRIEVNETLAIDDVAQQLLSPADHIAIGLEPSQQTLYATFALSKREREIVRSGGLIARTRELQAAI